MTTHTAEVYLGLSMEEWLGHFLSGQYLEGTDLMGEARACRSIEAILGACEDCSPPDTNLMCRALSSFGQSFTDAARQTLSCLEPRKQARMVLCIADTGRQVTPCLIDLLEHESPNVRAASCLGLVQVFEAGFDRTEIQEHLVDFFQHPPRSQSEWIRAFARLDDLEKALRGADSAVLAAVMQGLEDQHPTVRIAAIRALSKLGRLKEDKSNPVLIDLLLSVQGADSVWDVRKAALQELADSQAVRYVRHARWTDVVEVHWELNEPNVRGRAPMIPKSVWNVKAESSLQATAQAEFVMEALQSQDIAIRLAAAEQLKRVDGPGWDMAPVLLRLLDDPCPQIRWTATSGVIALLVKRSGEAFGDFD